MTDTTEEQQLAALIDLLSCNELDAHERNAVVQLCQQAKADPVNTLKENYGGDSTQIAQYDPKGVVAFVIFVELEDYFAVSDTVDEMHEQLIAAFEQPALPGYPYDDNAFETVDDYYRWLDTQLLLHHPKYRLIYFGESYMQDFQVILVYRDTVAILLELCRDLEIQAGLCE